MKSIEKFLEQKHEEVPVNFKARADLMERFKKKIRRKNLKIKEVMNAMIEAYVTDQD